MEINDRASAAKVVALNEVELYQCAEKEQLPLDLINCYAVQVYLRMCNVKYNVTYKNNTKDMSPTGEEPLLICDTVLVSDFETIIQFLQQRGITLTKLLEESVMTEMRAYISLIRLILSNAVSYFTWAECDTYKKMTRASFSSMYPWPLNWILASRKQQKELRKLSVMGWHNKQVEEVFKEIDLCLNAFSNKLDKDYFFGNAPTELDALLFAHVYSILTSQPNSQFASTILRYPKILKHCQKITGEYFRECKLNVNCDKLGGFDV